MEIVEVQFVKDTQNRQTGNEFYPSGSRAHFFTNQADILVSQGRAVLYNQSPANVDISPPAPDYSKMTVKQLRVLAVERGIGGLSGMRKADLIAALED